MQPNYPTGNYQNFLIKTNRLGNSIKAIYQNNYVFTFNTVFYYVNQVDYPNNTFEERFFYNPMMTNMFPNCFGLNKKITWIRKFICIDFIIHIIIKRTLLNYFNKLKKTRIY